MHVLHSKVAVNVAHRGVNFIFVHCHPTDIIFRHSTPLVEVRSSVTGQKTVRVERILWAYVFDADGVATRLDEASASEFPLAAQSGYVWIHLGLANARTREWLRDAPFLPADVRAELLNDDEQFHLRRFGQFIAGVVPDIRRDIGSNGEEDTGRLRFVADEQLLVTARRTALCSVEDTRAAVERGKRFPNPSELLGSMLGQIVEGIAARGRTIAEHLDQVEDRLVSEEATSQSSSVAAARRRALILHRRLQALLALLRSDLQEELTSHPHFGPIAERLDVRLVTTDRDVVSLLERARAIQDEISGRVAAASNRSLQALSIMTAIFVPSTLISSVFGMNTGGFPWKDHDLGTLYAVILCLCGSFGSYVVLRLLKVIN